MPAIQIPVERSGDGIDIPSLMKKVVKGRKVTRK